jgi:hypothetical protein
LGERGAVEGKAGEGQRDFAFEAFSVQITQHVRVAYFGVQFSELNISYPIYYILLQPLELT